MTTTSQCYFSLPKLNALMAEFEKDKYAQSTQMTLKGFVFTPGRDEKQNECVFAFPVFSPNQKAGSDGDILLQNTNPKFAGCPYPPPCDSKMLNDNCYADSLE